MNNLKKLRKDQIKLKCEICDKEFRTNLNMNTNEKQPRQSAHISRIRTNLDPPKKSCAECEPLMVCWLV